MKKLLTILLTIISVQLYADENIGYRVNYYDTVEFKKPFITPSGDTCQLLVKNDSVCIVCNSLDTLRISNVNVSDIAYDATLWNGNTDAATKNAIRDKIETLGGGHDPVTIASGSNAILSLSTQELSIDTTAITITESQIQDYDSTWNKVYVDKIGSNSNDSIIVDSTVYFANGINIKTNTESFSVSKTISFANQHDAKMTITNNTVITITNVPGGSNPQLSLIWSGGDYTASISGATQMSGNSTISLQETNGATDLVQFKNINGTVYYAIINVVTP